MSPLFSAFKANRLAGFLTLAALIITLEALWQDISSLAHSIAVDTGVPRFIRTVVCAAVSVSVVGFRSRLSETLLPLALLIAVIADYFLILENNLKLGIVIFAIMQLVLVTRHLNGNSRNQLTNRSMIMACGIGVAVLILGNGLLWNALQPKGLAIPVLIYSSLLIASTLAAFATRFNENFSNSASRLAFYGMILFVLCDITVGVGAAFGETNVGQFVRASTGLFYTPSLLLLAWSEFVPKKG